MFGTKTCLFSVLHYFRFQSKCTFSVFIKGHIIALITFNSYCFIINWIYSTVQKS